MATPMCAAAALDELADALPVAVALPDAVLDPVAVAAAVTPLPPAPARVACPAVGRVLLFVATGAAGSATANGAATARKKARVENFIVDFVVCGGI